MIQVRNLTKRYGNKSAVENVSFDIEAGKIYGFLGPNGAGKSSTMNIITGCIAATSGSVTVGGHDIFKDPNAAKKHIGYLPENPPLYLDMTPREYLTFVAEAKGVGAEKTYLQVNRVMEQTSITDVADKLMGNFSKGYCQRVGIAQALLGDPEVIILDEPTVGLDPKQIIEIRDLIRELGKTKTVILSSHILGEISAVCDQIMILSQGRLVANDTPEQLELTMNTGDRLKLVAKGTMDRCEEILKTVSDIAEYTAEFFPNEGCTHITLTAEEGRDIRETVFSAFADARVSLLHMATERMTLEDIFLKLTTPDIEPEDEEEVEDEDEDNDYVPQFSAPKTTQSKEDDEI